MKGSEVSRRISPIFYLDIHLPTILIPAGLWSKYINIIDSALEHQHLCSLWLVGRDSVSSFRSCCWPDQVKYSSSEVIEDAGLLMQFALCLFSRDDFGKRRLWLQDMHLSGVLRWKTSSRNGNTVAIFMKCFFDLVTLRQKALSAVFSIQGWSRVIMNHSWCRHPCCASNCVLVNKQQSAQVKLKIDFQLLALVQNAALLFRIQQILLKDEQDQHPRYKM